MRLWKHSVLPANVIVPIVRGRGVRVWGVDRFRATITRAYHGVWIWHAWDVTAASDFERGIEDTLKTATAKCMVALRRIAGLDCSPAPPPP
jgi:hypothetical protein